MRSSGLTAIGTHREAGDILLLGDVQCPRRQYLVRMNDLSRLKQLPELLVETVDAKYFRIPLSGHEDIVL